MSDNEADQEIEMVQDEEDGSDMEDGEAQAYLPGQPLQEDEELVCDESAYIMYHQAHTGAPCLSFDVLQDNLGERREDYPLTCYLACGTQAERDKTNHVIVMKMSNLHRTTKPKDDDDDDESSESEQDEDEKPELETVLVKHSSGSVNRIRCTRLGDKNLAATWSDKGKVHVWDLSKPILALDDVSVMSQYTRDDESPAPVYTFTGHQVEGYALDWSKTTPGRLLSGDCNKNIHLWNPLPGGTWQVDQRPFSAHTSSVEDIQWSPNEANVFASCSVDRSIRVWDSRVAPHKACMLTTSDAHDRDINVIHWNANEPFILSGGDDGVLKVWDLRQFQHGKAAAVFKHHTAPITSVQWHPTDSSVFAASGSDDQVSIWDLGVERDTEVAGGSETETEPEVPAQLLFIHQGQTDIKELHWHRQLPGVILSTAHSGFNVFRTVSV